MDVKSVHTALKMPSGRIKHHEGDGGLTACWVRTPKGIDLEMNYAVKDAAEAVGVIETILHAVDNEMPEGVLENAVANFLKDSGRLSKDGKLARLTVKKGKSIKQYN